MAKTGFWDNYLDEWESPWTTLGRAAKAATAPVRSIYKGVGEVKDTLTGENQKRAIDKALKVQEGATADILGLTERMYEQQREDTATKRAIEEQQMLAMQEGLDSGQYAPGEFNFDYGYWGVPDIAKAQQQQQQQQQIQDIGMQNVGAGIGTYENLITNQDPTPEGTALQNMATGGEPLPEGEGLGNIIPNNDIFATYNQNYLNPDPNVPVTNVDITQGPTGPYQKQPISTVTQPSKDTWYTPPEMPGEFSFTQDDFVESPHYQWLQDTAATAVERSAAARGGLGSGSTLAGLQNRAQNIAGAEFGNQFNQALTSYGTNINRARDMRDFDYGRALTDRGFAYGAAQDAYSRGRQGSSDEFNKRASLAGLAQVDPGYGMQYAGTMGNIYGQQANAKSQAIMGGAAAQQQGIYNLLGLGIQGAGLFSDKRLKKDIKPIGKWKEYNVYQFRYLWSPILYIGVMADEVKATNPGAVSMTKDGYLMVDYGRL